MKIYEKTIGYKWTNGNGIYYDALHAPDNAPDYVLVPIEEIPVPDPIEIPPSLEQFVEVGRIFLGE